MADDNVVFLLREIREWERPSLDSCVHPRQVGTVSSAREYAVCQKIMHCQQHPMGACKVSLSLAQS